MRSIISCLAATALLGALAQPVHAQPTSCDVRCDPCAEAPTLRSEAEEARATLAAAVTLFVPTWAGSTAYAWTLPTSVRLVDAMPIAGPIASAVRAGHQANVAGLLFAGGVQTMGVILAVIGATELHRVTVRGRELGISVAAAPDAMAVSLHMPW